MNARLPAPLSEALRPAIEAGAILSRCTIWPWVVTVIYRERVPMTGGGTFEKCARRIEILEAPLAEMPDGIDLIPRGAEFLRADVFLATRFDDMPASSRRAYATHYREFLMWRKARALCKDRANLKPWDDYDPVLIDETVQRWMSPGVLFTGD